MTFAAPRRFRAAFLLGFLPALALAQAEPNPRAGRTWTDPPARDATGPGAETSKPTVVGEAEGAKTAGARTAGTKTASPQATATKAATAPAPRTVASRPVRAARTASVRPTRGIKIAARPAVTPRMTAAPRMRGPSHDPAFRVVTVRPAPYAAPPVIRYGHVVETVPARPMAHDEMRAARIQRAEEAGYLVVRSRSVEFPDGRRLRTYRPLDEDD